ncbi:BTB domain-containing protein [Sergentomyia squamirostris]
MPVNLEIQPQEEEVWRKERGPIKERLSYFVNNEFLSDMTFVVGEERTRIPAHKFILSTCSWEFYNALYLLQLDKDEVPIEDVQVDVFIAFLKYCYTGEIDFSTENEFIGILKLSHRFRMQHLIEICEDEITGWIDGQNSIFWYTDFTFLPKESQLRSRMVTTIATNFVFSLQNDDQMVFFKNLPLACVREIATHEQLTCDEMQLFDFLMKWATHNCEKMNIVPNPINLRVILKDVFYKIRFPNMTSSFIFLHILSRYPNLLSAKELSQIALKINGDSLLCENFSIVPRENDTKVIKPSIDFSDYLGNVIPCFSKSLQFDGTSRHFSTHFKLSASAGDHLLKGVGIVVKRDHVNHQLKPCYYYITKSSREPHNFGPYTTMPEQAKTDIISSYRYHINWDYDVLFLRFEKYCTIKENDWYRVYLEFETALPHSYPADTFNSPFENSTAQLKIWKDDISLIPYLLVAKKN